MKRTVFVLSTADGYVADLTAAGVLHTADPEQAITFTSAEMASSKVQRSIGRMPNNLRIEAVELDFPRKTPYATGALKTLPRGGGSASIRCY